ncbi:hypothetical protein CFP56_035861 [Quercus suber]|uniref:BRX domain-containing protein n=1 Tax=Quercus suber TaxID=58331 RepID=A0AAW0LPS0_QUESU
MCKSKRHSGKHNMNLRLRILGVSFVKDVQKQEAWWERQHELVAENFGNCTLVNCFV